VTDESLAHRISALASPTVSTDAAGDALDALRSLGYDFVLPGAPGRYLENADQLSGLARHLHETVRPQISFMQAMALLNALSQMALRIREPDVHPSGLRTQAYAFTKVSGFGAKYTAAMKKIERSKFDGNGVEIPNR
jgi:hypothetical protein